MIYLDKSIWIKVLTERRTDGQPGELRDRPANRDKWTDRQIQLDKTKGRYLIPLL